MIALHVGRDGAVELLDFRGAVGFAAAFNKDMTLGWESVMHSEREV